MLGESYKTAEEKRIQLIEQLTVFIGGLIALGALGFCGAF